ncbi:hypothetical protein P8452_53980 [Trifolium repens]|nr:hypothetical protein P8452_53980 [Trifolium repens]
MHQTSGKIRYFVSDLGFKDLETCSTSSSSGAEVFGDLPPQAVKYIQQLQSELTNLTEVYVIGSSLKRIGKQIAFKLCYWTFIENNNGGSLVYSFLPLFLIQPPQSLYYFSVTPVQCKTENMRIIK